MIVKTINKIVYKGINLGKWFKFKVINKLLFSLCTLVFGLINYRFKVTFENRINTAEIRNILLVRNSGIGDMITFIPFLKSLRRGFKESKIILITSEQGKEIIQAESLVDEIIVCSDMTFSRKNRMEKIGFFKEIRRRKCDIFVSTYQADSIWYSLFAFFSGARFRIGFDNVEGSFLYNILIPFKLEKTDISLNLDIVSILGQPGYKEFLPLKISGKDKKTVEKFLLDNGISCDKFLVAINPCGKRPTRDWVLRRYAVVADYIYENKGKVIFTGGTGDKKKINQIVDFMNNKPIVASGDLSIAQMKALIKRCDLLLTVDTGIMHMGVAMGVKVLALFGPGDHRRWSYSLPNFFMLKKDVSCSPCYKNECVDYHQLCMRLITAAEVIGHIDTIIKNGNTLKNQ